jgi:hypothetical protein
MKTEEYSHHEDPSAAQPQPRRSDSRKGAKHVLSSVEGGAKVSFRPEGEIFVRSLACSRDDGPCPVT